MKRILAAANESVLAQFARSNTLVAFDYDGTLSPIVVERGAATMRAATRRGLIAVCERYPSAVISGRGRADVSARLEGVPVGHIVGNHGMEPSADMARFAALVAALALQLSQMLAGCRGVEIEDKRYSLAIHYRKSREKRAARAVIARAGAAVQGSCRLVAGKQVVNVIPHGAPHKGTALEALRDQVGADTAIFVGDDVTDENVFELDQPGRLLSIRVGEKRSSAAPYYLRDQGEIDQLLRRLVELRTPEPRRAGRQ
ncbi:MAG: trehalose-phosphatase [Byssovorax sp.]